MGEISLPNSSLTARDFWDNCKFLYSGPGERFCSIFYIKKTPYAIKIYHIEQWRNQEMKFGRNFHPSHRLPSNS